MSLFVEDDEPRLQELLSQEAPLLPRSPESHEPPLIPVEVAPAEQTPVYESREIRCTLPLRFHQDIVEDMLQKDGLVILGRGLGWEIVTANLLYALSSPSVSLVTGGRKQPKKSLVILLNAREDENAKLADELTDLHWINTLDSSHETQSPLTVVGGDITTAEKRRRIYDKGGCVSVTLRVLVVDLLSGVLPPTEITGLVILHAERVRETSNESFIVNLYRDGNDWGFVKAISDDVESFTGFTPLATRLKALRLQTVFLWPRFHVEVSSSLASRKKKDDAANTVTEVNVALSYKMNRIQSALLQALTSCLLELKRHNPLLATEYWDMENIHDVDFVQRVRLALEPQWHRVSWTSKQLVHDLATLKDLLHNLLWVDSLSFYQTVQGIIDSNVKSSTGGTMITSTMSPWLALDEANTVISYAKERALGKVEVGDSQEYVLEELPKWDQLGILLDDIMYEKTTQTAPDGPVLIMCGSKQTARQLAAIIPRMKKQEHQGRRRFSCRRHMVTKLNDYLAWKELSRLTKQLNLELDKDDAEVVQTSKTFSRGKDQPTTKRRRTRGAAAVANVNKAILGSVHGRESEAVDIDEDILNHLKQELDPESDDDVVFDGGFVKDEPDLLFHHVDKVDQIIIETYNDRTNDALLQEISPAYIVMYEPNLLFIRRVEIYQAINHDNPARTYFMYYGTSVEEQGHLAKIKKEKDAFTRLIREKANLAKTFQTEKDNWKFQLQKRQVVNTRIAGGSTFRTQHDEMKVIVDVREFRLSLPNLIYRAGMTVVPCMITVGDYVVSPKICIERKAIPDLIASFKSGRLYTQCEQMFRHYETPALLIEFDENQSFSLEPFSELRTYKASSNPVATKLIQQEIQSKLVMLLVAFPKLKIIWSSSPYETAQILLELKSNQEEPDVATALAKGANMQLQNSSGDPPMYNDDAIDLIQSIPGINANNYFTVISQVKNIEELVNLSKERLVELLGEENGNRAFNFFTREVR